ncbi:MAG: glycosyltransferase family 4 protein [Lachnospira sp.]|nr:glycosyltransferase family 4 protein [Lachnospira sp.]
MENKKKICFVAQFPPPIHGLSKAVETLYNSSINGMYDFEKVDITNNKKIIKTIISILKSNADLFYFTISQTIGGNIRDLIILKLFSLKNKKVLIHLHGGYYRKLVDNDMKPWQRKANYKAISKVDGAIVLGPSLKWIFEGMIESEKIYTVPNCVDDEFLLSNDDLDKKINYIIKQEEKHVLWLSNFIESKGYKIVLKLAKYEKEHAESIGPRRLHFDFAGKFFDKNDEIYFNNYIKENGLFNYVSYHGIVIGKKKKELLKRASFFILPTRYPKEGQPISILEAKANGIAVITTNHAGITDIIHDGEDGIILYDNMEQDIEYTYNKIFQYDTNVLSFNGWKNCREEFNQKKYIENMKKVYSEILN